MNTRRYPRTMQEAFGPYTSNQIAEDRPLDWQDKAVMIGGAVTLVCVLAMVAVGWIV